MNRIRGTLAALLLVGTVAAVNVASPAAADHHTPGAEVVTAWNQVTQNTIFVDNMTPIPSGQVLFGLVSLAVHDAVELSYKNGHKNGYKNGRKSHDRAVKAAAAASVAAHHVLLHYYPGTKSKLDQALATSINSLPAGMARDHGAMIGDKVAKALLASRAGDGWNDTTKVFTKPAAVGVWRPTPPATLPFLVPWLGFVDPIMLKSTREVATDGPPSLTSDEYADDFNEVKSYGAATGSKRSAAQTETAHFWNVNITTKMQAAMRGLITQKKLSIRDAAKLLALTNVSAGDAAISCWREKFDYGFWRPSTAIHQANADNNDETTQDTTWLPLFADPAYPEYPSGHACLTSAHVKAMRLFAGTDSVTLTMPSLINNVPVTRTYTSLEALRNEAFHGRIWLGIHFRFSMEASTEIGFDTAKIVYRRLLDDDRLDDVKPPKPPVTVPPKPPVVDDDEDADDDKDDDDNGQDDDADDDNDDNDDDVNDAEDDD